MEERPTLLNRYFVNLSTTQDETIRVMQMNVLADKWAPPSAFPHTDPSVLSWEHRKRLLLQQFSMVDPDILGLEEVDHFADHFRPALAELGYEGFFKKKNGEGDTDGCAIFFKKSKFHLIAHKGIDFVGHTQVAQLVRLRMRLQEAQGVSHPSREVCVAVVHLKAKEGFEEKRLHQGVLLLQSVLAFIGREQAPKVPLLVVGDFNDVPSSLVCRYFRREPLEQSVPTHPFQLRSSYALYPDLISEIGNHQHLGELNGKFHLPHQEPYTTFKKRSTEVRRTIDYIWYSSDWLLPSALLSIPPLSALPYRLPCHSYPSDHLALCVDFAWHTKPE